MFHKLPSLRFAVALGVIGTSAWGADCLPSTPPTGLHGLVDDENYKFEHLSTLEISGSSGKNTVSNYIKNNHTNALLQADWQKGGIETTLIHIGRCRIESFDTFMSVKEDTSSPLRYGLNLRNPKRASAYVLQGFSEVVVLKDMDPLDFRLSAGLDLEGKELVVDLRLVCSIKDGRFNYEIKNLGEGDVRIMVPELVNR